jgi:UDP-GlcNAc:undecaprenyl-phosphate GlcNAc-1-phosphate transferase
MLCGSAVVSGQWFVAGLAALLLGALTGFLFHNFPSARIYMGDGGSLVLGLLLSVLAVRLTYVPMPAEGGIQVGSLALITPLVILAVPLYDFVSVCGIRLLQGRSPFVGDQQHFSHRLVKMGLSRRSAVLVVWACTLATGLSGLMLPSLALWQGMLAFLQTLAILAVLAILEITHRKNSV